MRTKRYGVGIAVLAVALVMLVPSPGVVAAGQPAAATLTSYILPGNAVFPEGIAYQQATGAFYVGSAADGTIFRSTLQQQAATVFLPGGQDGRTTVTGMKVDRWRRLFVCGAASGKAFVYDTSSGKLLAAFSNGLAATFINDVALADDGTAYLTDSIAPYLYRITTRGDGTLIFETWLDFTGTALVEQPGFNANGIVISRDQRYLVVIQTNTGKLFRIDIRTKQVREIDLNGAALTNGDGLLLRGHVLYVVRNRNQVIVTLKLSHDFSRGWVLSSTTDPSFKFPTTIARARDRLLVVNGQLDKRVPGLTPDLPFTVSSIPVP